MQLLTLLLCSSALVAAAPRYHPRSSLITDIGIPRMSDEEVKATVARATQCWPGKIVWPMNDTPPPVEDVLGKQLSVYEIPSTKSRTLTIHNYCEYDIHYTHINQAVTLGTGTLARGGTFETPYLGTVWKGSKTPDMSKVVLIEYNVPAGAPDQLWYNLSLIECLEKKNGLLTKDASACPGFEAGLQLGNKEMFSFQCKPGTWCDDQAYFYYENMCKAVNPVKICSPTLGITMEFCAANKR